MLQILAITAPIFLLIGLGYAAARFAVVSPADMRVIGRYVLAFALPAVLFRAISQRELAELVSAPYLGAYAGGSLAMFALGFLWFRLRGYPGQSLGVLPLGMAASNSAFVGLPVVTQFLGSEATAAVALTMLVENFLMFPLALIVAEAGKDRDANLRQAIGSALGTVIRSPIVLAILAGSLASLLGLHVPAPIDRAIEMLAASSAPAALFVIGGSLVGVSLSGMALDIPVTAIAKLVLHPLAVAGMLILLGPVDPLLASGAIVLAASPMLSIYPILGQRYGVEGLPAAALVATTLASFVTISLTLWMLHP